MSFQQEEKGSGKNDISVTAAWETGGTRPGMVVGTEVSFRAWGC